MSAISLHLLNLTLNIYGHNIKLVKVVNYFLLQVDEKISNLVFASLTCQSYSLFWYSSLLHTGRGDPTDERKKTQPLKTGLFFLFFHFMK